MTVLVTSALAAETVALQTQKLELLAYLSLFTSIRLWPLIGVDNRGRQLYKLRYGDPFGGWYRGEIVTAEELGAVLFSADLSWTRINDTVGSLPTGCFPLDFGLVRYGATNPHPSAGFGWLVGRRVNKTTELYRKCDELGKWTWTEDWREATWYARRRDADSCRDEGDYVWFVKPVARVQHEAAVRAQREQ